MAVLSGNAGSIRLSANVIAEMDTWSLDVSTGLEETQAFSNVWKARTATIRDWSGTGAGRFDNTDTNGHVALNTAVLGGTTVSVRFYINGTNYYSGSAFVQASITAAENNLVTVSYTFTGNGTLSYT